MSRTESPDGTNGSGVTEAEAALWVVRGSAADESPAGLDTWLAQSESHAMAYADAASVWHDVGQVALDWKAERPGGMARRHVMAAAALCVAALAFILVQFDLIYPSSYETAIGEQRTVELRDGTRVTLNVDTEVRYDQSENVRTLTLDRGEILLDVAHDPTKPFFVETGGTYIRALGTTFVVKAVSGRLDVTLLTGSVMIGEKDGDTADAITLSPGDRYSREEAGQAALDKPDTTVVTAWRHGKLILEDTPLSDAIREMNRYSTKPIVVRNSADDEMRLSGVFRTGQSYSFAKTVAEIYDLKVDNRPDGFIIKAQ